MENFDPAFLSAFFLMAVIGLCFGSFATALIARIPEGVSWIYTQRKDVGGAPARSRCLSCGHVLKSWDLIPLFSWLFMHGKCRYCKVEIPAFYPLTELTAMVLTLALFSGWKFALPAWPIYAAVPFLLAAIVIDWRHMILPDVLNAILFVTAVAHVALVYVEEHDIGIVYERLAAAVALTGLFYIASAAVSVLKKKKALGMGDLKFLPSAGLFLGLGAIPFFCITTGLFGIFIFFLRKNVADARFPFGPALIASLYLHLFLTGIGFDYTW